MQKAKLLRYLFLGLWFGAVPLALAWLLVEVVKSEHAIPTNPIGWIRFRAYDQWVPALIVAFTLFEMLLYNWKHALPGARLAGVAGRLDLPPGLRREYEQAGQLLEESARILHKYRKSVERHVPPAARESLAAALEQLRTEMEAEQLDATSFCEALDRTDRLVVRHLGRWRKSELREYAESILIAVAVALVLRAFVVEAFKIPSESMLPTLQVQDHIFVNKLAYGPPVPLTDWRLFRRLPPKRGDVMVFRYPVDPQQDFIKRVIALEGDTLEVRSGHPWINGWEVPHCKVGELQSGGDQGWKRGTLYVEFLGDYAYLTLFEGGDNDYESRRDDFIAEGPYRVAPGEVWVLGDNRNNSSDSRAWNHRAGGGVPYALIKGKAMFVWLSFGPNGGFNRLLHNVMGQPRLPKPQESPALLKGIEDCLSKRPSITLPPPPR